MRFSSRHAACDRRYAQILMQQQDVLVADALRRCAAVPQVLWRQARAAA